MTPTINAVATMDSPALADPGTVSQPVHSRSTHHAVAGHYGKHAALLATRTDGLVSAVTAVPDDVHAGWQTDQTSTAGQRLDAQRTGRPATPPTPPRTKGHYPRAVPNFLHTIFSIWRAEF